MSRVITFSRTFPKGHPKEGQPTHFIEKVWASLIDTQTMLPEFWTGWFGLNTEYHYVNADLLTSVAPKHHTIRAGKRWKVGDKFSPRIWSGKPYKSKQIQFAPDIEVKKVFDFRMTHTGTTIIGETMLSNQMEKDLFRNDGLNEDEFVNWFMPPNIKKFEGFSGQIISWNEDVNY